MPPMEPYFALTCLWHMVFGTRLQLFEFYGEHLRQTRKCEQSREDARHRLGLRSCKSMEPHASLDASLD